MRDDSSRTIHLPARPAVPGRRPARRAEPPTAGRRRAARSATALTTLLLALPTALSAQSFERVGTRALGFAGAFVAVADDATAPFWNPAGLWTGSWVDARVDGG